MSDLSAPGAGGDPRDVITEQAFSVAPELLGLPLATPGRRVRGILFDLFFIALLSDATGVLLAGAAAWVLFRTVSKRWGATRRVWVRVPLAAGAAALGFALLLSAWGSATGMVGRMIGGEQDEEPPPGVVSLSGEPSPAAMMRLQPAGTPGEARERASEVARDLAGEEMDEDDLREMLEAILPDSAWAPEVARSVARAADEDATPAEIRASPALTDSLVAAYAAARARGDSVPEIGEQLGAALARDELAALSRRIERLETRNERLAGDVEDAAGRRGVIAWLRAAADDLGLGFGWSALYFTAFLVLGRGRTPGKRLAGTRVVRLDGRPITWWVAFERFGGYVAGVFTGLLDYFLLVRDPNRQALHDKIVNTVVIRE